MQINTHANNRADRAREDDALKKEPAVAECEHTIRMPALQPVAQKQIQLK